MKFKNILLSSLIFSSSLVASDCVCFKLEGEFGKELKALIEKHQGKLENTTIINKSKDKNKGLFSIFTVEEKIVKTDKQIEAKGKSIYKNKCSFCHGQNAELAGSGTTVAPINLSEEELTDSLYSYSSDDSYGGSMRMIMSQYVDTLSKNDMQAVAKYIKSLK
jgi:cytochrome c553